jgi:hypothetical protein
MNTHETLREIATTLSACGHTAEAIFPPWDSITLFTNDHPHVRVTGACVDLRIELVGPVFIGGLVAQLFRWPHGGWWTPYGFVTADDLPALAARIIQVLGPTGPVKPSTKV